MTIDVPGLALLTAEESRATGGGNLYGAAYNAGYVLGALTAAALAIYIAHHY